MLKLKEDVVHSQQALQEQFKAAIDTHNQEMVVQYPIYAQLYFLIGFTCEQIELKQKLDQLEEHKKQITEAHKLELEKLMKEKAKLISNQCCHYQLSNAELILCRRRNQEH